MRNPGPHIFKNAPNRGIMWRHIRAKKAKKKQTCKNRAHLWCLTLYRTPGFRLALCRERIQRCSRLAALPKKWALTWKRYVITSAKGFYLSRPGAFPVIGYFQRDAVRRLKFIKRAQELGFSLREIRELLALRVSPRINTAEIRRRAESKVADIESKIATLESMKKSLRKMVESCSECASDSKCPILDSLDGQAS